MKNCSVSFFSLLIIFLASCTKESNEFECTEIENLISNSPYNDIIYNRVYNVIGFNFKPIQRVIVDHNNCSKTYVDYDKYEGEGFYLLDPEERKVSKISSFQLNTPEWSSDGSKILFTKDSQVNVMPFTGLGFSTSEIKTITHEGKNFFPSWSDNDSLIVYDSNKDSPSGLKFIWLTDLDGTNHKRIAYSPELGENRMPKFLNDSTIVFIKYIGESDPEIFSLNHKTNDLKRLTANSSKEVYPTPSPDKKLLAFISNKSGTPNLFVLNFADEKINQITTDGCSNFSWGDEGDIYYVKFDFARPVENENGTLWKVHLNTNRHTQITFNL